MIIPARARASHGPESGTAFYRSIGIESVVRRGLRRFFKAVQQFGACDALGFFDSLPKLLHNALMNLNLTRHGPQLARHVLTISLCSLVIAISLMFSWDSWIAQFFARPEMTRFWLINRELTHIGLSEHYFIAAILIFIYFKWISPRNRWLSFPHERGEFLKRWALNLIAALIMGGIVLHIIKLVVGRARPHKTAPFYDALSFDPITTHWHWHSFPSGHSQTMFTVATMMALAFPRYKWIWFGLAAVIAFTRAVIHDHFLSDVVFGSCLGYCMTLISVFVVRKCTRQGL